MTQIRNRVTVRQPKSKPSGTHRVPARQKLCLVFSLALLMAIGQISYALADTGITVLDQLLELIDQYKLGIAIMGLTVIALGFLARPLLPEASVNARTYTVSMVVGGILLILAPTIAAAIVGS
jgi:hypothetical protein